MKWLIALSLLQSAGYRVGEMPMPYSTQRSLVVSLDGVFSTVRLPMRNGHVEPESVRLLVDEIKKWKGKY